MPAEPGLQREESAAQAPIPSSLADRWELLVKTVAERSFEHRKKMMQSVGGRPYNGLPVSREDLKNRWAEVRHDQQALVDVLAANIKIKPDGRVLIKKEFIASVRAAEKQLRDGGYE